MVCKRCQGITAEGVQCKNKISCDLGCTKYCHIHSKGYPNTNVNCTVPSRRVKSPKKKSPKKKSPKKASPQKNNFLALW